MSVISECLTVFLENLYLEMVSYLVLFIAVIGEPVPGDGELRY